MLKKRNNSFPIGILFYFATYDKNVLIGKSTQAYDMTVLQRYCNVDSTNSSVVAIFVLAVALLKTQIKTRIYKYCSVSFNLNKQDIDNMLYVVAFALETVNKNYSHYLLKFLR